MLDEIFMLGETMREALEVDDMDAFFALLEQRGALVEQLGTQAAPAHAGEALASRAEALTRQHAALVTTIQAHQQRLATALDTLTQVKQARERYGKRHAKPRILNKKLCG